MPGARRALVGPHEVACAAGKIRVGTRYDEVRESPRWIRLSQLTAGPVGGPREVRE